MKDQEIKYNNARIRVHFPDRTEEQKEVVKRATETFLKKAMQRNGVKQNGT